MLNNQGVIMFSYVNMLCLWCVHTCAVTVYAFMGLGKVTLGPIVNNREFKMLAWLLRTKSKHYR